MCQRNIPDSDMKYVEALAQQVDYLRELNRHNGIENNVMKPLIWANINKTMKAWIERTDIKTHDYSEAMRWHSLSIEGKIASTKGKKP